ncbi:sensor histidine kinase [Paenibacillus arenilitoris]|uniref:histidine kinase n=1 Tax=Paenibacillus arenilitoris TaxID=2772299 RepID=A0A927CP97_9BACL|nr:sensor histidine kinase [Paenibacillus arenilitoris]MBD2870278.1 sensor histidine kinase [Paenibacillus arenilitoris]
MKKLYYGPLVLLLLLALLGGCSAPGNADPVPEARAGTIDLRGWSFGDDGSAKLNGEWAFYDGKLIGPDELPREGAGGYAKVPAFWSNHGYVKAGHGHGTYRLLVKLDERLQGRLMAVYMPFGIESAYRLWINGKEKAAAGKVGTSRAGMEAKYLPQTVVFPAADEVELVIQVSNYVQRTGGIWDELRLGYEEEVTEFRTMRVAQELFVAGGIVIMGMYHLGLYFIRRKDLTPLYFGGFCLLFGLRSLFLGEVVIHHVFPDMGFELYKKIEYIGQYFGPALFLLYVRKLFPEETHIGMVRFGTAVYGVLGVVVVAASASVFTPTLVLTHILLLVLAPYVVSVFIRAAIRRREGALFCCVLFVIMALTIFNDLLYYNSLIQSIDMAKFGVFAFIFAQAFLLSRKFSKAFYAVEELSNKQARWSQELEQTVDARTNELQKTLGDLKDAQRQLVESEKMAALGALVAGIAHEINTPVGVSVTAASHLGSKTDELAAALQSNKLKKSDLDHYVKLAGESSHIISYNLKRASELINGFKLVAADRSHESKRSFNVKSYLREVLVSLGPKLNKTKLEVILEGPDDAELFGYPGAFSQILTNLLMNSMIHAYEPGEEGVIRVAVRKDESTLILTYADDGRGMAPEVRDKIFDPFFTTNRGGGGTGLGMHIIYNLVTQTLGGRIECESEPGRGAVFTINLPLEEDEHDVSDR